MADGSGVRDDAPLVGHVITEFEACPNGERENSACTFAADQKPVLRKGVKAKACANPISSSGA
jgi:hypothetical protein